jgi:hypothetical protein
VNGCAAPKGLGQGYPNGRVGRAMPQFPDQIRKVRRYDAAD